MSKTQPAPAEAAAEAKPKKGKKLIVIIAAAVLLLGGGGGGAWFFLKPKPNAKNAHAAKSEEHEKPPAFVDLDTFTVNLQPQSEGQFLQATLVAKLKEEAASEAIKARMPEIKDRVLMLLSSKSASDISSLKGKQQLGRDVTVQIKQAIGNKKQADQILGVLFTSFVIQ